MTGHRALDFTPGVLDRRAVKVFTEGWCWALALTIEDRTGMPVCVVSDSRGFWLHSAVMDQDGTIIDIEGRWDPDDWLDRWQLDDRYPTHARLLTDEERVRFGCVTDAESAALKAASAFVDVVVAEATHDKRYEPNNAVHTPVPA